MRSSSSSSIRKIHSSNSSIWMVGIRTVSEKFNVTFITIKNERISTLKVQFSVQTIRYPHVYNTFIAFKLYTTLILPNNFASIQSSTIKYFFPSCSLIFPRLNIMQTWNFYQFTVNISSKVNHWILIVFFVDQNISLVFNIFTLAKLSE